MHAHHPALLQRLPASHFSQFRATLNAPMLLAGITAGFSPYDIMVRMVCFEERMEDEVLRNTAQMNLRAIDIVHESNRSVIASNEALSAALTVSPNSLLSHTVQESIHCTCSSLFRRSPLLFGWPRPPCLSSHTWHAVLRRRLTTRCSKSPRACTRPGTSCSRVHKRRSRDVSRHVQHTTHPNPYPSSALPLPSTRHTVSNRRPP